MLANGLYGNGLITMSQTEKGNLIGVYCKSEGLDFYHLMSQTGGKKSSPALRKAVRGSQYGGRK